MGNTNDPYGADKLPAEQPPPNPDGVRHPKALSAGSSSRWLLPAGVLAVIAAALFTIAFGLQPVIPIIGIVYVVAMWIVMLLVARRTTDAVSRNRNLMWLMIALAGGAAVLFLILYFGQVVTGG